MFEEAIEKKGTNTEGKTSILIQSYLTQKYIRNYGSIVSFLHCVPLSVCQSLLQEILLCFEEQKDSPVIWKKQKGKFSFVVQI